ncbi:MAG: hypothetical protein A2521_00020 [Deltaproteobacteria bacterium RIFOXYD12_FULL_57_12]|nr:MAG: hypothetical protein A2521_00020 [Deltaproteobacteria bacterium RIFOXYD12_FULL_57_12]
MANKDFHSFVKYMVSLWGALGSIAVVFPMADILFNVIPLPVDAYEKSTAAVAIPLTSLVAAFTLLYTFVQRDRPRSATARTAGAYFMLGLMSLLLFFLLEHFEYALRSTWFPGLDSTDDYVLMLVAIVPFYVAFFACVTRAFAILALIEFTRHDQPIFGRKDGP